LTSASPAQWERLCVEIKVPVATALRSSALALKALGATRILLMTPVDDKLKELYRDYLAGAGFAAVYPPQTLHKHTDALKLTPQEVAQMTRQTFAAHPGVEAIYFQGALLDPLPILDQLETELRVPIVASSLARMWDILSQLGRSYKIPGYGILLANWPPLPRLEKVRF
jgi:maleate cis-trans isomerase